MKHAKSDLKVCLMDGVSDSGIQAFRNQGINNIHLFPASLPDDELIKELQDTHIIGIRSKTQLSASILKSAPELLCVGRYGIGVNNVDLKAAEAIGIPVFNGPYASTRSVAEMVIGLAFSLLRRSSEKSMQMHQGIWDKTTDRCFELRGKTLGLIGYGNTAAQVSVMAESLGMNVIYSDVRAVLPLGNAKQVSFKQVLDSADIVSIHVPGHPSTVNLFNEQAMQKMKPGSYLINTSRGTVVDINALCLCLDSGKLAGAALDVFPNEPKSKSDPFESPLTNYSNVILTPHISGATLESQTQLGVEVSGKMIANALYGDSSSALNYPHLSLSEPKSCCRLLVVHQNKPGVMATINDIIASEKVNIRSQVLQTTNTIGVVSVGLDSDASNVIGEKLKNLEATIRCRIISQSFEDES
ncbi:MAG: D-3-phosphoglycerate dehydrogenase [Saprospiraceae bacterium]|jgi:D-3-phosphoglycerate dehydrogenase